MLTTITIFIAALILINFLLLKFSINKTAPSKSIKKPLIIRKRLKVISSKQLSRELALAGS